MYKIHEVLKRTDWAKLSQQKATLQRTTDAIGEALNGENDAMKAPDGMTLAKFETIKVHLNDLLQWIEQIEKCAEAAGYAATYPYCLQAARRYVLT